MLSVRGYYRESRKGMKMKPVVTFLQFPALWLTYVQYLEAITFHPGSGEPLWQNHLECCLQNAVLAFRRSSEFLGASPGVNTFNKLPGECYILLLLSPALGLRLFTKCPNICQYHQEIWCFTYFYILNLDYFWKISVKIDFKIVPRVFFFPGSD